MMASFIQEGGKSSSTTSSRGLKTLKLCRRPERVQNAMTVSFGDNPEGHMPARQSGRLIGCERETLARPCLNPFDGIDIGAATVRFHQHGAAGTLIRTRSRPLSIYFTFVPRQRHPL